MKLILNTQEAVLTCDVHFHHEMHFSLEQDYLSFFQPVSHFRHKFDKLGKTTPFTSHPPSPHLQELEAGKEVIDVRAEGFEGGVGHLHPHARDLALQDAHHHLLQVRGHHHQTLQHRKPGISVD